MYNFDISSAYYIGNIIFEDTEKIRKMISLKYIPIFHQKLFYLNNLMLLLPAKRLTGKKKLNIIVKSIGSSLYTQNLEFTL